MVLKKILVTGSRGMLGSHLVHFFKQKKIHVLSSSSKNHSEMTKIDLSNEANEIRHALNSIKPIDAVLHAAAEIPSPKNPSNKEQIFKVNISGTNIIAEWCLENNIPLVFYSGAIIYDEDSSQPFTESSPVRQNFLDNYYAESKFLAEQELHKLIKKGLKCCILRPSSIYGTGLNSEKLFSRWIEILKKNNKIVIDRDEDLKIDLIHARDVAEASFHCLVKNCFSTYNVGTGHPVSLYEIAVQLQRALKKGGVENPINTPNTFKYRMYLNSQKIKNDAGFIPNIDLSTGIKYLVENIY